MNEFFKVFGELANRCAVKVLKIDLESGTYKIIHLSKGEAKSNSPFLKDWVEECCNKELVHYDYIDAFKQLTELDYLKKTLKYKSYIHFKFKRCSYQGGEYRTNVMSILPIKESNPFSCYLVVYDIDD